MISTNFKKVRLFKLVRELNVSLETLKEHLEQNGYADALTGSGINAAIQDEAAYNELVSAFADNQEAMGRVHKKRERQIASEAAPVSPAEPAPEAAVATGDETEPLPETILKIGVGHLFATGNRPDRDEIFHIAGMRYSEQSAPEERDWIINPGRHLTRRLYDQSRISNEILAGKPSWEEARSEIVPFFADLDVLFVYDRENQKEWFCEHILNNTSDASKSRHPVLVDLLEMARFFLPDQDIPSDKDLIQRFVPEDEWRTNDPRLPLLVRGLSGALPTGGTLKNILDQIRAESKAKPGTQLVYSLFAQALTRKPPRSFWDFYALLKVADIAHRLQRIPSKKGVSEQDLFAKLCEGAEPQAIREADFLKAPDIESDARKRKNWLTRQWTALLSEEATQGLDPVSTQKRIDRENPPRVARPVVNSERVDDFFDWLIKKEDFRPRQEQKDFARFCVGAINQGGAYAIEAGTGTGKTLGYLVPACECIRQSQAMAGAESEDSEEGPEKAEAGKVIIATSTKNLQDQLVDKDKDWARLVQTGSLYQDFKAATLKGRNNFLCITAVADLFAEMYRPQEEEPTRIENRYPNAQARKRHEQVQERLAWLFLFLVLIRNRGEKEGMPWNFFRERFFDLDNFLDESKADVACTPDLCRMDATCVYPRHLQKAQAADIVVTNHYKLPSMDSLIQALGHTCLIDEADQFPDNLRKAASVQLDSYEIHRRFLWRIQGSGDKRSGFAEILEGRFTKKLQKEKDSEKPNEDTKKNLETAIEYIRSILASCEAIEHCSNAIGNILQNSNNFRNNNFNEKRWIDCLSPLNGENLQKNLSSLAEHSRKIAECWDNISKNKIYEKAITVQQKQEKIRILKYMHYANELSDRTNQIQNDYPSNDYIHICFCDRSKYGYITWTLKKIPYDISKIVQKTCCDPYPTTIFTSATLFVDGLLHLFSAELGMPFECDAQKQIPSPFKYVNPKDTKKVVAKGFVTNSIPPYVSRAPQQKISSWRKQAAAAIARLAVAMKGRTLVLFTSKAEMNEIFKQVQPILEEHGIEPLLQDEDGSSLAEINTFASTEESVLFGVKRFWTGVDFPGPTLSQVIVVRLPNPNPSDPIMVHRQEVMGDLFSEKYYRPASKLKFRQGFGRLIRKETDKGLFVVLDQRIRSNENMCNMQSALLVKLHPRSTEPDQMDWFINEGLTHLGLKAEFESRKIDLRKIRLPD